MQQQKKNNLKSPKIQVNKACVKAIVITNPSNPCGSVYSQHHLLQVLEAVKQAYPNAVVIADEIYSEVVFNHGKFHPLNELAKPLAIPIITLSGIAKNFYAPGMRIGWIACSEEGEEDRLARFKKSVWNLSMTTMGPSSMLQAILPSILLLPCEIDERTAQWRANSLRQLDENVVKFSEKLREIEAVQLHSLPQGAMYIFFEIRLNRTKRAFADIFAFCQALFVEENVILLPGTCTF